MTLRLARSLLPRSIVEYLRSQQSCFHSRQDQLFVRQFSCSSVCRRKHKQGPKTESGSSDDVNPNLKKAVRSVAKSLPGDAKSTESDLLKQLQLHSSGASKKRQDAMMEETKPETPTEKRDRLKSILAGMKVTAIKDGEEQQETGVRRNKPEIDHRRLELGESVTLFKGPGLGIFDSKEKTEPVKKDGERKKESLWDKEDKETLDRLAMSPPQNAFEELIQLTKEGKLWTFPINNEAGMMRESRVGFHEHVFLDRLIKDFPSRGPLRHFMELVTTGLSQNPYLTVQQKEDHIHWFRRYFKEKQAMMEDSLGPDGVMKTAVDSK